MRRLVEDGRKDRAREWDIRPARLAFSVGTFGSRREADVQRRRLHELRLPAYVLSGGGDDAPAFRLYAGAFESAAAATVLDSLLRAAGVEADLEVRRGERR
jgi:hypothetical protein